MKVAGQIDEGVIVTVLSDDGSKYLSEKFRDE
jgi:cysteine synthase